MSSGIVLAQRGAFPVKSTYQEYRQEVREHADFSCSYCTVSEVEAATIGFEIDHYYPQQPHPSLIKAFPNLYYCCRSCNGHKLGWDPADHGNPPTARILRYDVDDWAAHVGTKQSEPNKVEGMTPEGQFHVDYLYLNHQNLCRIRGIRRTAVSSEPYVVGGVRRLRNYPIDQLPSYLKGPFFQYRRLLMQRISDQDDRLDRLMRAIAAHPNADPDPTLDEQRRARRKMLKDMGVISARKPRLRRGRS